MSSGKKFDLAPEPQNSTYVVRAEIDEGRIDDLRSAKNVIGVYADVKVEPIITCGNSWAVGTDADVERLLCVPDMRNIRMDGNGVWLAIVDSGINLAHLTAHGRTITVDASRSWMKTAGWTPGMAPVDHGTMCAFDAAIAAPNATFLDIQISRRGERFEFDALLSDAVRAYSHLVNLMMVSRPFSGRSMVVSNSWGMFHPSWDEFKIRGPFNYADNLKHPFNRIVSALEVTGADILFAAGNCGSDCPDSRCEGVTTNAIYGANGHPSVLTIAGVDITNTRVGYSTQGPGRLSVNKPDLCGYTHFQGSGVNEIDGGTSAACPVVAGVVAAMRSMRPFQPRNPAASPAAMRALMRSTAIDRGGAGFDFDYGFGVVNGCALLRRLRNPRGIELTEGSGSGDNDLEQLLEVLRRAGYFDGQHRTGSGANTSKSGGCSCSDN